MAMHQPSNNEIANHLALIAEYYKYSRDKIRYGVFSKAEANVRNFSVPIISGDQAIALIPGIDKGVGSTIGDFIRTSLSPPFQPTSTRLQNLMVEDKGGFFTTRQSLQQFSKIHGVGDVTAPLLVQQGYRRVEDLVNAQLNDVQRWGLYYYYHFLERIPRSEMDEIIASIKTCWNGMNIPNLAWIVAGSYRRGAVSSGDIDILVKGNYVPQFNRPIHPRDLAARLIECGLVKTTLASGDTKYMGVAQLGPDRIARRIDITVIPPESISFGLLHHTGSDAFNAKLRGYANNMGLTINEYRMKENSTGREFPAAKEIDIFHILGLEYVAPEHRTGDVTLLPLRRY